MLSTVFFFLLHLDVGGGKKAGMRHYKGKHHFNCLSVWNDIMRYIISFNATLRKTYAFANKHRTYENLLIHSVLFYLFA